MSLEFRNSIPVYYRNVRRSGKPCKEYVASGMAAELVADVDQTSKEQRQQYRDAERQSRQRLKEADDSIFTLERKSELLNHAAFYAAGYHQRKREWRLKRVQETEV
ncbi:MAG: hypothetical protein H6822_19680 [Planctomycetaceae bacterium]|nr:hypothetical protein [Planctomycetaceae bacterium]